MFRCGHHLSRKTCDLGASNASIGCSRQSTGPIGSKILLKVVTSIVNLNNRTVAKRILHNLVKFYLIQAKIRQRWRILNVT
jgi:TolA-binding protein